MFDEKYICEEKCLLAYLKTMDSEQAAVLRMRRGNRDNLGTISMFLNEVKHML